MRIIAGSAKNKRIKTLPGEKVRPTSDRIKESLFSMLNLNSSMKVLDLFSGTGNLGIEALSRGVNYCTFVEISRTAFNTLKENVRVCRFENKSELIRGDVYNCIKKLKNQEKKYDLIFADPPYEQNHINELLSNDYLPDIITSNGLLMIEHSSKELPNLEEVCEVKKTIKWSIIKQKVYGGTYLTFLIKEVK
ncbi:Ribosomal RNA small subunit methyltransferase D [Natranaerofaba carboxydovora]|nr:Ribosomal RNA small subunit methyltransferase D [Natranaerofaba carboxydovora]